MISFQNELQKQIVHLKSRRRRNVNNSSLLQTSTLMLRNITLDYKSVTTWT